MSAVGIRMTAMWQRVGTRYLPFADAVSEDLPLSRLLRLSLFQISVAMVGVLLTGTLNRVMIVELHISAALVSLMVAVPLVFAPLRALIGFKSDTHRSALGWRRVPYIWFGTLLQFGGLAIMPFALLLLSGISNSPAWIGTTGAALAFLLVGLGMHTTQTAGLALAADLATPQTRPRVVALLYVMLLVGTLLSALVYGLLLRDFTPTRLVQVVQGAALLTLVINVIALWKQEARKPSRTSAAVTHATFAQSWTAFNADGRRRRFLVALGLGTAAFAMQDVLLEPYGGEILKLPVAATTTLTAFQAVGTLLAFALAARRLASDADPYRLASYGLLAGVAAFSAVVFAAPLDSPLLFRAGSLLIGFGTGLFAVATLTVAMDVDRGDCSGFALGVWGAVQASAAGLAIAAGGFMRDAIGALATSGALGTALDTPVTGYAFVYHVEVALLFSALIAIGPLVRTAGARTQRTSSQFGLADFPG